MKRTATLIALLLAASPALAVEAPAGEKEVRALEKGLTIDPGLELPLPEIPMPELNDNRPFPVNAKIYKEVRDHLENYGGDGRTSDGNSARCVRGEGAYVWITACMNYATAGTPGGGVRVHPTVLRWYTGPVEVQVSELKGDEIVSRVYYVSTSGALETVIESIQPAAPPEPEGDKPGEIAVRGRTLAPSSIEALMSWEKTAKTILTLLPRIEI